MLGRYLEQLERSGQPLSLIMSDLDHFKQINDAWGHVVGDKALVQFSTALQKQCRPVDLVARFGGEEFIVLLPGHPLETAAQIAERLRKSREDGDSGGPRGAPAHRQFWCCTGHPRGNRGAVAKARRYGPLPREVEGTRPGGGRIVLSDAREIRDRGGNPALCLGPCGLRTLRVRSHGRCPGDCGGLRARRRPSPSASRSRLVLGEIGEGSCPSVLEGEEPARLDPQGPSMLARRDHRRGGRIRSPDPSPARLAPDRNQNRHRPPPPLPSPPAPPKPPPPRSPPIGPFMPAPPPLTAAGTW